MSDPSDSTDPATSAFIPPPPRDLTRPAGETAAFPTAPGLPPPPAPGSRFAGYEILAELGKGGMGLVYRAYQLAPGREVALKVIRPDRLEGLAPEERRQWLERFRSEAQLVAALDQHPNIVALYEVGEHEGQPYFIMP